MSYTLEEAISDRNSRDDLYLYPDQTSFYKNPQLISSDVHSFIIYQGFSVGQYNDVVTLQNGYVGFFFGQSSAQFLSDYEKVSGVGSPSWLWPRGSRSTLILTHSSGNVLTFNNVKLVRSFKYEGQAAFGMYYLYEFDWQQPSSGWVSYGGWNPPFVNPYSNNNSQEMLNKLVTLNGYFDRRYCHHLGEDTCGNGTHGIQFVLPFLNNPFISAVHANGTVPYLNLQKTGMPELIIHRNAVVKYKYQEFSRFEEKYWAYKHILAEQLDWHYFSSKVNSELGNYNYLEGQCNGYVIVADGLFQNLGLGIDLFKLVPRNTCMMSHRRFLGFMQTIVNKTYFKGCRANVEVYDEAENEWWQGYTSGGGIANNGPTIGNSHFSDCSPKFDELNSNHYPVELVVLDDLNTYMPLKHVLEPYRSL
jgi:hypothetical protein